MNDKLIKIGDKTYKEAQVIMLPTEKSKIFKHKGGDLCFNTTGEREKSEFVEPQHLYIVTSEEIKKGDWVYHSELRTISKIKSFIEENEYSKYFQTSVSTRYAGVKLLKIVAATDTSLTIGNVNEGEQRNEDGLLKEKTIVRLSDDFIKKFCKLNGWIKDVLVEYEQIYNSDQSLANLILDGEDYTIKLKVAPDNTISIIKYSGEIIQPADSISHYSKSYTEEDLRHAYAAGHLDKGIEGRNFNTWLNKYLTD